MLVAESSADASADNLLEITVIFYPQLDHFLCVPSSLIKVAICLHFKVSIPNQKSRPAAWAPPILEQP